MPEVIFNGPAGRLEGRYQPSKDKGAPIAMVLHPHPQFGGTMNNKVVYNLHYAFYKLGFTVLRFNFRGVGKSQGYFDNGPGELADAASALDWLQLQNPDSSSCWIRAEARSVARKTGAAATCPRRIRPLSCVPARIRFWT